MAYFEKSLQAVKTFHKVVSEAHDAFEKKQSQVLKNYKDPTALIQEARNELVEIRKEQEEIFCSVVQAEFGEVRAMFRDAVTAAPPADLQILLEAIKVKGSAITEAELAFHLEKYRDNFLAFSSVYYVLQAFSGKKLPGYLVNVDELAEELNLRESELLSWCKNWNGLDRITRLLLLEDDTNPITATGRKVQNFVNGRFTVEDFYADSGE